MHDTPPNAGRSTLRAKWPELLVEGISVALAVVLALAVDEWRENRSNAELASRAEESIGAEVHGNLERLRDTSQERDSLVAYTRAKRAALVAEEEVGDISINFSPAFLARTAWETAQVTRALHFMDYDQVAHIGRLYEVQTLYEDAEDGLIRLLAGMGQLNWDEPVEAVDVILPLLVRVDTFGDLLVNVYERVEARGFEALDDDEAASDETEGGAEAGENLP
jgi:hypothetical protein